MPCRECGRPPCQQVPCPCAAAWAERGNAVKGNVEYRSRAAEDMPESPLTGGAPTREGNGRPFPSAPRRVRGLVRRGQRPLPAIGFWGCRPAALFFQKGEGDSETGAATGRGTPRARRVETRRAARPSVRSALRRSTRLYVVKGSVLPFISKGGDCMSYVIARVIKVKSTAIGAMQYHNDRAPGEHLNPDIDPERTHLNYELRCRRVLSAEEVRRRGRCEDCSQPRIGQEGAQGRGEAR